jgi:hypothetical protein
MRPLTCFPVLRSGLLAVAAIAWVVPAAGADSVPTLEAAQHLFYNAQYRESAALAIEVPASDLESSLAIADVRSSAVLFQIKRLLAQGPAKASASTKLARCGECPALIATFLSTVHEGQAVARTRLKESPSDQIALFYLGKLDLNYLWLQLESMGKKTGWSEYWEARKSLDTVLAADPQHVRARVARAWMEYIVDTRLPWGTEWLLGGGDRKKALAWMRQAAAADSDHFEKIEAEFALWEMLVKEHHLPQATEVASRLAIQFPENRDLARFVTEGVPTR